ncbi:MAG: DUF2764 domain-containing protein [Tannerella sp.]|jgi:hypothetical protein|nr:DUF2764 domain-containing protein [Tannerella sp.]
MSKYYSLIAGLPVLNADDVKPAFTVADFMAETMPLLTDADKTLVNWLFFKYDNANTLAFLRQGSVNEGFDERATLSSDELKELCDTMRYEDHPPTGYNPPNYLVTFISDYYARFQDGYQADNEHVIIEDKLSSLYYDAALACGNEFLSSWFELNLNIGNVLTALNCRKYGLQKEDYIIGNNELADLLATTGSRDLNTSGIENEYMPEIMHIAEEENLMAREKRIDALRWQWLEAHSFFKTFDIESVIAYILRLDMLERWQKADISSGETSFRQMITTMKQESAEALERFGENHK